MNELKVKIKPTTRKQYLIKENEIGFEELKRLILLANARKRMEKVVALAKKTGLSKMSNKEIDKIIKESRQRAKNNH
jgi:hypothetical protein